MGLVRTLVAMPSDHSLATGLELGFGPKERTGVESLLPATYVPLFPFAIRQIFTFSDFACLSQIWEEKMAAKGSGLW